MAFCNIPSKYLSFFNLIFAVATCTLVYVNVKVRSNPWRSLVVYLQLSGLVIIIVVGFLLGNGSAVSDIFDELDSGLKALQMTLVAIGVVIFVAGLSGCCGVIQESSVALLLLFLFTIQLFNIIYAAVIFGDYKDQIKNVLGDRFIQILTDQGCEQMFENLAKSLECCGVESFVDSLEIHRGIPYVCCVNVTEGCNVPDGELWKSGCVGAIVDVTSNAAKALGGAAIAAFLVEVTGAIFAFRLAASYH